jgi:alkylation response protein AidB-like acyl-CoA dehydrogenase
MDFGLNEPQEMLQTYARDFLEKNFSDKLLKKWAGDAQGDTRQLWGQMAGLGWTALSIPEAYGGVGDFFDLCLVLEEIGRAGLSCPLFSTVVLGVATIMAAGSEAQKQKFLAAIAQGKSIFTLALTESSASYAPESIKVKAAARPQGFVITGAKLFVPDAHQADYLICAARTKESADPKDGITLFLVDAKSPGLTCHLLDSLSGDRVCEVIFKDVSVPEENILGTLNGGWPYLEKVIEKAAVATCAEMAGGARRVLDMTLAYAKERAAFGHPIGAYQSIQHRCADMLIDVESSKYVTYQAAWRLSEGLPAAREAAIAKLWAGQAFSRVVTSAHQVHGAIGFTEDHVLHWFTRRARAQAVSFGDENFCLDKLTALSRRSGAS